MKQLKNTKVLLLVGMVLLMAACTAAWQRGRNAEQSGQNATNHTHTASKQDSLRLEDVSLGIIKDSDNFKREWHIIDTTKQQALLLTPQNVYTTYKYLWKIQGCDSIVWMNTESDYTPSTPKDSVSFFSYYYLYYKGMRIHENPSSLVCQKNNKVFKVSPIMLDKTILSINPEPTINFTQALDSAIIKAFPPNTIFRAQYLRVPTAKSLNKIPSIEQLKKRR